MSDRSRGLYQKYLVKRRHDPEGKHDDCDFFVLDLVHDKHARPALLAYADSAERDGYQALARDLRERAESMPEPAHRGEGEGGDPR